MKKFGSLLFGCLIILVICQFSVVPSFSQRWNTTNISPDELYNRMINNPAFIKSPKGEGFCWQARGGMTQFISNYEATKNTEWIDAGLKYCDFMIDRMDIAPDGYKGWIGPFLSDRRYYQDVLVGDALLFEGILDYCILIMGNKELKKKYGVRCFLWSSGYSGRISEKSARFIQPLKIY